MVKNLFKQYKKRLVLNGIIKSLILGLIVGFAVDGVVALVTWFIADMTVAAILGLSIGLGVVAIAASTPVFYFIFFRPTTYKIARCLDDLGLEERMITMCELEQDPSYIAMKQREDAQAKLSKINAKSLKLTVSMLAIVLLITTFVFAAGFTTVSALAATDVIKHGGEIGKGDDNGSITEDEYFTVNYLVYSEGGRIEGETTQIIEKGKNTTQVTAVPDEGYVFYKWTDESGEEAFGVSATRMEFNVQQDLSFYAVFQPIDNSNGEMGGSGDGEQTEPGDGDNQDGSGDQSGDGQNGDDEGDGSGDGDESNGDNGDSGDGEGNQDSEVDPGDGDSDDKGDNNSGTPGNGAGEGGTHQNNNVIDGQHDYREDFDRGQHEDDLAKDDTIPDDLKDILGDYYDSLKP